MKKIAIGDIVQLKSGGCDMTVSNVEKHFCYTTGKPYTEATVMWHDDNFTMHKADIDVELLVSGKS